MKKVKVEKFKADDGTLHDTEAECLKHEVETKPLHERLVEAIHNSPSIVFGAMTYRDNMREVGALIEECARLCAKSRIAAGGAKRKRKGKTDAAPNMGEEKPEGSGFGELHDRDLADQRRTIAAAREGRLVTTSVSGIRPTADNPFPAHGTPRQVPAAEPA